MAILVVVLYHCNALPGGYVGVDVFFVISGYLITAQLARELTATGRISFRGFYARRARRILPAATVVTIATVVASGLLLSPLAARRVFDDARAASVFAANIHFAARDADYFNADLLPSPMQHYWSLSVEEQFYLVWPPLLVVSSVVWLGVRRRRANAVRAGADSSGSAPSPSRARPRIWMVIAILGAVAALSFAGSVIQTPQSPSLAYYSIVTRAWELAAGALVALAASVTGRLGGRLATVLTWLGVACIAIAAMSFDDSTPFPGVAALLPVAGAVAIIAGGSAASPRRGAEVLLGTRPFQRLGGWSYSWYLWHWPVLILAPALLGHSLSELEALIMAVLSLVLAVISFVFVERPIRRMEMIVRRPSLGLSVGAALVAITLTVVALSGPVLASLRPGTALAAPALGGRTLTIEQLQSDLREGARTRAVPSNLVPSLTSAAQDKPLADNNGCLLGYAGVRSKGCAYGDTAAHTSVVLFGDSHAAAWFPAMDLIGRQQHWRLVIFTKSGCPPAAVKVLQQGHPYPDCATWRRNTERQIAALHPALIVVASSHYTAQAPPLTGVPRGHGSIWANGTATTFAFLRRSATHAVWIADVPTLKQPAPDCVSAHMSDVRPCTITRRAAIVWPKVRAQELELAARYRISAIDPLRWFCTPVRCPVIVGNILLYRDAQHMVPEWSRFLAPVLAGALTPIMRTDRCIFKDPGAASSTSRTAKLRESFRDNACRHEIRRRSLA